MAVTGRSRLRWARHTQASPRSTSRSLRARCADPQGTVNCQNVVGNDSVNQNLQAQIAKYHSDLSPLRFYPIVSFGASYTFRVRKAE